MSASLIAEPASPMRVAPWVSVSAAIILTAHLIAATPRASAQEAGQSPAQRGASARDRAPPATDTDASVTERYRALIQQALGEYEVRNYEEARELFRRAHAIEPNARTHRALGMAEFELRNYAESIRQLDAALASPTTPLDAQLRAETQELLERARGFVGRLVVQHTPANALLIVDGTPLDAQAAQALLLRVGEHTLVIQAPGYIAERRSVSVTGGAQSTMRVALKRANVQRGQDDARAWYRSPWLWSAVGLVVVSAAAGSAIAVSRGGGESVAAPYGGSTNAVLSAPEARRER
jgi:tetratricopeptide (TPR) repeat protein